jgi:23S rRNA pseudoU1915 N3-methylase RlmH
LHIQSASLAIPLSRTPLQRLGSKFAYARAVDFPVMATLSISAILNEVTAGNLANILNDENKRDITLTLKGPNGTSDRMIWTLKGCKLDSESFSSSIGSNKSVELAFSTQIGGPNDLANGIFVSGANNTLPFQ